MSNRKAGKQKATVRKAHAARDETAKGSRQARRGPGFGLILGLLLLGALVSLGMILALSGGPESARQASRGGITTVPKSQDPPPVAEPPSTAQPVEPPVPLTPPESAVPVPRPPAPPPAAERTLPPPAMPEDKPPADKKIVTAPPAPPMPAAKPAAPAMPPPEAAPRPAPALPWEVRREVAPQREARREPPAPPPGAAPGPPRLPSRSELRSWVKSAAREFAGGVDADGMPLYRFDIWLEAPADIRPHVQMVSYEYFAPSAKPPSQSSNDATNDFRVKFGAASCAEKATVTLVLTDGRERKVTVDGCKVLN